MNKYKLVIILYIFFGLIINSGCSEKEEESNWEHTYADEYSCDDKYHWYSATCEHSEEVKDKKLHYFNMEKVCTTCGYAQDIFEYSYDYNADGYEITGMLLTSRKDVIIPDTYDNKPVVSIASEAFKGRTNLKNVTIPSSVVTIGQEAFRECTNLESIIIPSSVTTIGVLAFYNCSKLSSITIPESVEYITPYLFSGCSSLKNVILSEGVKIIDAYAFSGCSSLETISIPNSVMYIGEGAFSGCYVLQYNQYESSYYLGNEENKYVVFAKTENRDIESCIINENTKIIGPSAFMYCEKLKELRIPKSVIGISSKAFYGCSKVVLYFEHTSTNALIVAENWSSYELATYWGINNQNCIKKDNLTYVIAEELAVVTCYTGNEAMVEIPELISIGSDSYFVTAIGPLAFNNNQDVKRIFIPDSILEIYEQAFKDCKNLTIYSEWPSQPSTWVENWFDDDTYLGDIESSVVFFGVSSQDCLEYNGIVYVIENEEAIVTKYIGEDTKVIIPDIITLDNKEYPVTKIAKKSFASSLSIEELIIGNNIITIEEIAFYMCSNLKYISFSNSVTTIGDYAFSESSNMKYIYIPKNIVIMGKGVFGSGISMKIYTQHESRPENWAYTWDSKNDRTTWNVNEENTYMDENFIYVIENGKAVISKYIGEKNYIKIPRTIEFNSSVYDVYKINKYAFTNDKDLRGVYIPENITNVSYIAFIECRNLTIFVEHKEKPDSRWDSDWCSSDISVYWDTPESFFTAKEN